MRKKQVQCMKKKRTIECKPALQDSDEEDEDY